MHHSNVSGSLQYCIGIIAHIFLTLKIIKLRYYIVLIMCYCKQMRILQGNGGIDPEPNETLFLLSDDQLLPLMNVRPLSKLMDR